MIIHRVRASGFQIIADSIDLDFPEEGKIGIFGTNESGKTTLLDAIEYALYGVRRGVSTRSRENIVTWGKEEAKIEVEFTSGEDRFLLTRTFNIRGDHRAKLIPIVDGQRSITQALTSLTDIETKIEQITGMDRDSFTKLVYIKQKDLDALKDLGTTKREQLINKVMGIEIFDDAIQRCNKDLSQLTNDIRDKDAQLTPIRENAKSYLDKSKRRNELQDELKNVTEPQLNGKNAELHATKSILDAYAWLFTFNSKTALKTSKTNERNRTKLDSDRLEQCKKGKKEYEDAVKKYQPEMNQLEKARASLISLEDDLERNRVQLGRLNASRGEALKRANLTEEHREAAAQDLQKRKQAQLIQFMLTLILSVALIAIGILTQLLLTIIGIGLAGIAVILYMKYQKTDRLLTVTAEIQALNKQIEGANRTLQDEHQKLKQHALEVGFKNHEEVDEVISATNEQIMQVTGQPSIDRVEPLIQSAQEEIARLERADPNGNLQRLELEISEILKELKNLEEIRPPLAKSFQYDEAVHRETEKKVDVLRGEAGKLETDCAGKRANIAQLETEVSSLKIDFDRLPNLEVEYKNMQDKETVLGLVIGELDETSRKLRSQVMPYARLIINQILPILTDGRYSEFEIAEDLKFKAHSNEAGGYKEREIFSGGTQDQFLIALRLAFTQSILDSRVMADRYCLLMDECISSSDDQRKQGIFEVLDATKKTFSQIFVIAHEDISNFTDHHIVLSRNRRGYTELRSKSW